MIDRRELTRLCRQDKYTWYTVSDEYGEFLMAQALLFGCQMYAPNKLQKPEHRHIAVHPPDGMDAGAILWVDTKRTENRYQLCYRYYMQTMQELTKAFRDHG